MLIWGPVLYYIFRAVDWMPILGTLRINKTLEFIAVRSFFQQTMEEQGIYYIGWVFFLQCTKYPILDIYR